MFIDDTIAQCSAYGFVGGPTFNTRVTTLRNARERRNAEWANARHSYSANYLNIPRGGTAEVRRMFYVCRGRLNCFRFRDPMDFTALDAQFGVGNGVATVFQLSKPSTADGLTYNRRVALPVGAVVLVNGVSAPHSVNVETGEVTFTTPPGIGAVLTWSGEFDVKVRFDQDDLPFSIDNVNAHNGSINLIEVFD